MTNPVADFIAILTNCLFIGEEWIELPDDRRVRGLIRLTLDGFSVELTEDPSFVLDPQWSKLRGEWKATTQARILDVPAARRADAEGVIRRLAELLGFAMASEVGLSAWEHSLSSPSARHTTTSGVINYLRPLIFTGDGSVVRKFVEETWVGFNGERDRRNLNVVFHYLALAEREDTPLELKLAIHFIALEQLKHSFAVSNGYEFLGGSFHVPGTVTASHQTRRGFRALLNEMFSGVGMNTDVSAVVDLRNEILHSGLSALPFAELMAMEGETLKMMREYLLRLLGYSGEFFTGEVGGITSAI